MEWVGILVVLGAIAYGLLEAFGKGEVSEGRPPYPPIRLLEDGAFQIIDLRGVPFPGNTHLALDFALEALRTRPPFDNRVWVLPAEVRDHFLELSDLVWVIIGGRLTAERKVPGMDALYVPGATPEQERRIAAAGVTPITELTAITEDGRQVTLEERLGPVPSWSDAPERPVLRASVYKTMLCSWVAETDDAVFVDLLRVPGDRLSVGGGQPVQDPGVQRRVEARPQGAVGAELPLSRDDLLHQRVGGSGRGGAHGAYCSL
jgi:hypothetical protein